MKPVPPKNALPACRPGVARVTVLSRRRFLRHSLWLGLLFAHPSRARPRFVAVRAWPAEEYTRLTIEASETLTFEPIILSNPDRLVIDIRGAQVEPILRTLSEKISPNDPFVANVRVGQFSPEVTRLVIDLKQPVRPQIFTLTPVAEYQHRLVIDLNPLVPKDPIERLLAQVRQREADTVAAASGPADKNEVSPPPLTASDSAHPPASPLPLEAAKTTSSSEVAPSSAKTPQLTEAPPERITRAPQRSPSPQTPSRAKGKTTPYVVVLDPGHGGEDPGAIGRLGTREKDVVLAVANRVKRLFDQVPNIRAVLTRDDDYFVPLGERVQRARRAQADVFISIHADASPRSNVRGSSVYVLNERGASSTAARWLADQENRSDLIGGVKIAQRQDAVAQTLLDLSLTATRRDSEALARAILQELGRFQSLFKPTTETANFAVLRSPDVPSVLVELAFITNPLEETRLNDPKYQARLAQAIYRGVTSYLEHRAPRPKALLAQSAGGRQG